MRCGNWPQVFNPRACSIRGLRRDSSNKTAVVPNFALYLCFVGVINSIRVETQYGLNCALCSGSCSNSLSIRRWETPEKTASQFSLSFVLWTHFFSLLAHREFWYMPSTPRGSVGTDFSNAMDLFSVTVWLLWNFCTLDWSQDFVLFRGLHEDFGGSSSWCILNQVSCIFNVATEF